MSTRVHLVGRHANRTPLGYAPYRALAWRTFRLVDDPAVADLLVFGFVVDLKDELATVVRARTANPLVQIVVLSEEPLWDTLWSGPYTPRTQAIWVGDELLTIHLLNHWTTRIFGFERIPYFLTTDDRFFVRYQARFARNAAVTANEWLEKWHQSDVLAAFVAEKRLGPEYAFVNVDDQVFGLCDYRTRLAQRVTVSSVRRVGAGWAPGPRRQDLPDWHLDKLQMLDGRCRFVSGLENTHCLNYVTEKIFDAFAVGAVPVYFAAAGHHVHRLVPEGSFVNVYGHAPQEAALLLEALQPDRQLAERYCLAQATLRDMFRDSEAVVSERQRVLQQVLQEFEAILAAA